VRIGGDHGKVHGPERTRPLTCAPAPISGSAERR
jgi:hypothetical protein